MFKFNQFFVICQGIMNNPVFCTTKTSHESLHLCTLNVYSKFIRHKYKFCLNHYFCDESFKFADGAKMLRLCFDSRCTTLCRIM
jgi:hypothetical protein